MRNIVDTTVALAASLWDFLIQPPIAFILDLVPAVLNLRAVSMVHLGSFGGPRNQESST